MSRMGGSVSVSGTGLALVDNFDLAGEAADLQDVEVGGAAGFRDLDADHTAVFRQVEHDSFVHFPRLRRVFRADFDIERIHVLEVGDVHASIFPDSKYSMSACCTSISITLLSFREASTPSTPSGRATGFQPRPIPPTAVRRSPRR